MQSERDKAFELLVERLAYLQGLVKHPVKDCKARDQLCQQVHQGFQDGR